MYVLAMLSMLVDHAGLMFDADQELWRIIGRFAMPIYAYCLVQAYKHTRSKPKYMIRLGLIAAVTQLPYYVALNKPQINIVATFLICFMVLIVLKRLRKKWMRFGVVAVTFVLLELVPLEYGGYALLLILIFRYLKLHAVFLAHVLLNSVFLFYKGWTTQVFSFMPTVLIMYGPSILKAVDRVKISRWIWRTFYPAHLIVLAAIKLWRGGGAYF